MLTDPPISWLLIPHTLCFGEHPGPRQRPPMATRRRRRASSCSPDWVARNKSDNKSPPLLIGSRFN